METSAAIAAFFKAMFAKGLLPAIIGALIAVIIGEHKSKAAAFNYFVCSILLGFYGGLAISAQMKIEHGDIVNVGILLAAVFGLNIVVSLRHEIPAWIRAYRIRRIGRDPDSVKGELK